MTKQELIDTVMKTSFTRTVVHRRFRLSREFLEKKLFSDKGPHTLTEFLATAEIDAKDKEILASWGDAFFDSFTKENCYDLLKAVEDAIGSLSTISLYIPYLPEEAEAETLATWIRANVNQSVLIDLHTDPSLIGGCGIAWQGVYHDYSLRYFMMKNKVEVSSVLDKYVQMMQGT